MDTSTIQPRQDTLVNSTSSQRTKNLENNEPALETRSDNDQDNNAKVSEETITFSDTSLKLSSSSPVQSSDKSAPIENEDQARQALNKLIADFQNSPSLAEKVHSNVFSGAVKTLLG